MAKVREVQSLRAIAILLVAGYHYFASWTMPIDGNNLYPGTFAPIFQYTWLGVELFFMVSGFVIAMTLLRTRSAAEFAFKRFLRLWPALFVALPLVFFIGNVYGADMYQHPWSHLLASLTLIDPQLLNSALPITVDWVTAVLWTMWIEIQFYVLAGLIFFLIGKQRFLPTLTAISGAAIVLTWVGEVGLIGEESLSIVLPALSGFLPWFLAGAIFHHVHTTGAFSRPHGVILVGIWLHESALLWHRGEGGAIWLPTMFFLLFVAVVRQWRISALLRGAGLVFLGEISYEFYLVHDTIGVTTITAVIDQFGESAHLFGAVLGAALSVGAAALIFRLTTPIREKALTRFAHRDMTASS